MTQAVLDYEAIAARYRRMRAVSFELNKTLVKYVSKEGLESTAQKLGLWHNGILVFDDEDESSILFDQAIYGHFTNGSNAVDRYLADHPPAPGSDQEAVLAAQQRSFYSLFQVKSLRSGVGVHVDDILRERKHFMADVGSSRTADMGLVLATRVLPFEDFLMTSGAPLPVDADTLEEIIRAPIPNLDDRELEEMTKDEMADFTAAIIRLCLKNDSSRAISYQYLEETESMASTPAQAQSRIGRNDPCPCGSGRKYKKCCGK